MAVFGLQWWYQTSLPCSALLHWVSSAGPWEQGREPKSMGGNPERSPWGEGEGEVHFPLFPPTPPQALLMPPMGEGKQASALLHYSHLLQGVAWALLQGAVDLTAGGQQGWSGEGSDGLWGF